MSGRALRVLMTADTLGGVFTYAVDLAGTLATMNVEVVLATMGRPLDAAQRADVARVRGLRVVESTYALEWMDDPWRDVDAAGAWLLALEREYAPDVVHLNGYAHATLPFRAPVLVVGHSCVCSWWRAVKGEAAPAGYAHYRERVRSGLRAAAVVVTPTRAMEAALLREYGEPERGVVIPNGCDLRFFHPRDKRNWVLGAGRIWDEAKNLAALAEIAPTLPVPVRIAGERARPGEAAGTPSDDPLWLGTLARPTLAALLGEAAIYALPARYEPFGLSVLEAAASGAALVLGDVPSLRELWEGAALFVPPDDRGALRAAIARLAGSAGLRSELGQAARLQAQRFGLHRMGTAYRALYAQLTGEARMPIAREGLTAQALEG